MAKLKKSIVLKKETGIKNIGKTKWTVDLVDRTDKIATTEDLATTMIQTAHQFNLMTQSILQNKFGFTDKELKDFNNELAHALEGLAYFEEKGLHPLSLYSLNQVVDITMNNYKVLKAARSGISLIADKDAAKLLMKNNERVK